MGKIPVYAIVAVIFLGIIKLLQVTAFDAERYEKSKQNANKPLKSSKPKKETPKKEPVPIDIDDSLKVETNSIDTTDPFETAESFENQQEVLEEKTEPKPQEALSRNTVTYEGFNDLKNQYLAPILASLPEGQLRQDVVIRYYKHLQDGERVYALRAMGYYVHEKEANETAGLGSNAIYYGEDVAVEDIQLVAYTLISTGLPIQAILPTAFEWKSNAIEIGTDPDLNAANLTEKDISSFSK